MPDAMLKFCQRCEGRIKAEYIWTASSLNQMLDNMVRQINGEEQMEVDPPRGELKFCECKAVLVSK